MSADVQALLKGRRSTPVTPDDEALLDATSGLWVGTGGDVVGMLRKDTEVRTFKNVPDGTLLPFDFKIIHTDTTADDLVAVR